ncbi:hypothetical protein [Nocardia sp. MH4]|nr:hypothetical protein [Nocardia sp. MH4]
MVHHERGVEAGTSDTDSLRARVAKLAQSVPLYQGLEDWRLLG